MVNRIDWKLIFLLSLSLDLHQRIITANQQGNSSQADIATRFSVGTATVERLIHQWMV